MTRLLALLVLPALWPVAVHGAEWTIDPSVSTRASVTDNLNLTPGLRETVSWWTVSPAATFSRRSEVSAVEGTARVSVNRYPSDERLDTTDQYYYGAGQYRTERNVWGVSATYLRDSTLQTELQTTGVVQSRNQRTQAGISPYWSYSLTERTSLTLNYQDSRVRYEPGAGLQDYSDRQVFARAQYLWSERVALTLTGAGNRYETDSGSIVTETSSLVAGITYGAGERWSLALDAGIRYSDSEANSTVAVCPLGSLFLCQTFGVPLVLVTENSQASDDGWLLKATSEFKGERTSVGVLASRDINPSGSGLVVETDQIALELRHEFGALTSGSLTGAYLRSRYLSALDNVTDYYRVDAGLSRRLDERWTLGAGYGYQWQKAEAAPQHAEAHTLYLNLGYNWPRISMSR